MPTGLNHLVLTEIQMSDETQKEPSPWFYELEGVISDLQAGIAQPSKACINTLKRTQGVLEQLVDDKKELTEFISMLAQNISNLQTELHVTQRH